MPTTLENITLPDGLSWVEEFNSSGVAQTTKRTLAGSLVVFHAPLVGGRDITLESSSNMGWVDRDAVEALQLMSNQPGMVYSLLLRGVTYNVLFRHQDGTAFEATPVLAGGEQGPNAYFQIKLRLMTV